jgi:hypothetical protein
MSGFGAAPFGAMPAGASILPVVVSTTSADDLVTVSLVCEPDSDPGIVNPYRTDSVFYWRNWVLTAINPIDAKVRYVQAVTWDDETKTLVVGFDGRLQPGAVYELTAFVTGIVVAKFTATTPHSSSLPQVARENVIQDWAKPERTADLQGGEVGTLQTKSGDFAITSGAASLHERITRRVLVSAREFAHDPNYGEVWTLKGRLTIDLLQRMQSRLLAQVKREPDVSKASVSLQQIGDALDTVSVIVTAASVDGRITTVETSVRRS